MKAKKIFFTESKNGVEFRERVSSFSLKYRDPTVGSLRDKKESCSTRRGLRVGTGFKEFKQTP